MQKVLLGLLTLSASALAQTAVPATTTRYIMATSADSAWQLSRAQSW